MQPGRVTAAKIRGLEVVAASSSTTTTTAAVQEWMVLGPQSDGVVCPPLRSLVVVSLLVLSLLVVVVAVPCLCPPVV